MAAIPREASMLQRGDIVVERLTGNRAIVICIESPEEITCRFGDGRLEDRYLFELEPVRSLAESLASFVLSLVAGRPRGQSPPAVSGHVWPMLVRQAESPRAH
jgi:hypothetical protein